MPVFLLFLIVPLIEIALFVTVGGWLTLWPTLGLVVLTAIIGSMLVRRQGIAVLGQLQRAMAEMSDPVTPLGHGAMILLAGILLITPGFFTDALGFSLLVPPIRTAILRKITSRIIVVQAASAARPRPDHDDDVIDAEFEEVRTDAPRVPSGWTRPPGH